MILRNGLRLVAGVSFAAAMCFGAGMATAENPGPAPLPLPPTPRISNSGSLAIAFNSLPLPCRKEVQKALTGYGFYHGRINGSWSTEVAQGVVQYVGGGNLAYSWPTVPGAKGILWHIGFMEHSCPMPPYDS